MNAETVTTSAREHTLRYQIARMRAAIREEHTRRRATPNAADEINARIAYLNGEIRTRRAALARMGVLTRAA